MKVIKYRFIKIVTRKGERVNIGIAIENRNKFIAKIQGDLETLLSNFPSVKMQDVIIGRAIIENNLQIASYYKPTERIKVSKNMELDVEVFVEVEDDADDVAVDEAIQASINKLRFMPN